MTPPLTDTELLAYIERTPELAALFPDAARWLSPHAAPYANVARAFHAHEQRVREEERKIISAGLAFIMGPGGDEGTRMGLHPDRPDVQRRTGKLQVAAQLEKPMASTPLTDAELLAYIERTPECATCLEQINPFNRGYWVHGSAVHGSAGGYMPYKYKEIARAFHAHEQRVREEAAEAVGLLRAVYQDLLTIREWNHGRIGLAASPRAERLEEIAAFLAKQGGK